ncbi:MAG TPA: hypothetical protein VMS65_11955 [Polyangiaceae bacterium]|nr:hypothetical protein [Polyangiaceae bacterium]
MATTLREFELAPEEPISTPPRRRRYVIEDESGARPLPRDHSRNAHGPYAYGPDPLDEQVDLPRERAGLLFGIGAGLGVAVLAVVAGLYLGGYVGRPALGPTPDVSTSLLGDPQRPLEDAQTIEALELARIAPVWIDERSAQAVVAPTQVESPDIHVINETHGAQPANTTPARQRASRAAPSGASGEELDAENPYSDKLSNELDELQHSLRPRGPTAPPKEPPTSAPTVPEEPALPPPAAPTAPAETIPPAGSNGSP